MSYRRIPDENRLTVGASTSGRPETGIGTFVDVETARAYIRAQGLNSNMSSDIVATISGTTNRLTSTTAFDAGDSGSNGYYVIYRGAGSPGTSRTLGSSVVTGWALWSGSIYRANVGTGLNIQTMWEDGVRARKCRSPKFSADASYPLARPTYRTTEGVAASHTVLQYVSGNYSPGSWTLTDAQAVIFSGGTNSAGGAINWFQDTIPISSLNLGARQFTLSQSTRYDIFSTIGSRYYIQGVIDLLTEAGEFHYDSTAGFLYYWPRGSISSVTVEIPRVTRIFSFIGTDETTRCRYIQLDGLGIEQSNFTDFYRYAYPNSGDSGEGHTYPQYDRVKALPSCQTGMVYMTNADHIKITRCRLKNSGFSAVFLNNYNQSHWFEGNLVEGCGGSGFYVDGKYPGEGDVSKANVIYNCKIRNVGELDSGSSGLFILNSGNNLVHQCTITGSPRNGVFIGAGTTDIPAADCYARGNRVQFTAISNCAQDSGDVGGIGIGGINSLTGGPYLTNYIFQVTIDGIAATSSMNDAAPNGVFFDNKSYGQNTNFCMVTNTAGNAMRLNDSNEQTVANSTFTAAGGTNGSFSPSVMQTADIGVTSTFPYA